jgi:hypothetical protein
VIRKREGKNDTAKKVMGKREGKNDTAKKVMGMMEKNAMGNMMEKSDCTPAQLRDPNNFSRVLLSSSSIKAPA